MKLIRGFIVVQTHRPTRPEVTRELVDAWYRNRAHIKFPERIELCLGLFPDPEAFRTGHRFIPLCLELTVQDLLVAELARALEFGELFPVPLQGIDLGLVEDIKQLVRRERDVQAPAECRETVDAIPTILTYALVGILLAMPYSLWIKGRAAVRG